MHQHFLRPHTLVVDPLDLFLQYQSPQAHSGPASLRPNMRGASSNAARTLPSFPVPRARWTDAQMRLTGVTSLLSLSTGNEERSATPAH
jgi:hypothetical protein